MSRNRAKGKESKAPPRAAPPIVGKVTHHSIELYWEEDLSKINTNCKKGDGRVRVTVQEQDKNGGWGNVYTGYAKKTTVNGLEEWTPYTYRIRFMNDHGDGEWSPVTQVTTTKEPLTGEHLHKAILLQDLNMLNRVLDSGDLKDGGIDSLDKYGFSPLMQAAQKGYIEFLEALIEKRADVNFQNEAHKTPLMLASYAGKLQSVKELWHHGAKHTMQDKGGSSALHWAMDSLNVELIDWMLENGADIEAKDYNGWTPLLRVASVGGNREVAHHLVRSGAKLDQRDKDGKTALMIAVVNGHAALVELLLSKSADVTVKNEYGKSAYEMAVSMERRSVIKMLEDHMDKLGIKYY